MTDSASHPGEATRNRAGVWHRRLFAWGPAVLIALMAAWRLRAFLLWDPTRLTTHGLLADDAFFYSVLARNFDRFGFLTLDGEMPTNGVQPLWMLLQIALVKIFPGIHETALNAASSWAFYILFCLLAARFLAGSGSPSGALRALFAGGLVLANPRVLAWTVQGLETPLVLLLYALLFETLRRASDREPRFLARRDLLALGILSGLCFLARTDQFWLAIVIGGWLLLSHRRAPGYERDLAPGLRDLLFYFVPLALLVLPYLAHNLFVHGGLMPVSGAVKAYYVGSFYPSLSAYLASDEWWALVQAFSDPFPFALPVPVMITAIALAFAIRLAWRRDGLGRPRVAARIFSIAAIAHALTLYLFYRELMTRNAYYFAPTLLWAVWMFAEALPGMGAGERAMRRWSLPLAAMGSLVVLIFAWMSVPIQEQRYWLQRVRLAEDARRLVPQGESLGAFWPGTFAQFSGRPVIPLDGVAGSRRYLDEYIKQGRELDYLLERGHRYLATHLPMYPDSLLASESPLIMNWTRLGVRRIWEMRDSLDFRVLAARRVAKGEGGWCLLELARKREE
ncbi:MAG: hypothetical protein KBD56_05010 [Candidatus Eisenbacteria bacterium]|nr:hypothetical protein [Candidatus Eisenbacteria bacterium]